MTELNNSTRNYSQIYSLTNPIRLLTQHEILSAYRRHHIYESRGLAWRKTTSMDIVIIILLVSGLIFFTGGSVGIIRFPDFYSRLHPAGKLDTAGHVLTMSAMALYTLQELSIASLLTAFKIILIVVFVFFTSPTATHAIIDAGVRAGLNPWTKEKK